MNVGDQMYVHYYTGPAEIPLRRGPWSGFTGHKIYWLHCNEFLL